VGFCWMEFDQQKWVVFHDFHGDINFEFLRAILEIQGI
jgi:hypothetical protein